MRTILHVDMDAFYAAIEVRDLPELRGKPVVVGSDPKGGKGRGIVATASYEARKFGIHSAQPISTAYRLCPHAVYLRPDMGKYARVSGEIMEIFLAFTDLVEPISIDEAFLDCSGSRRLFGSGREIACSIRERIRSQVRLTASVGVASNKFVAKVASDFGKPDGLVVVEPGQERAFLEPLPIRRLWGVGPKTENLLRDAGIARIGDLARLSAEDLQPWLGNSGEQLGRLAQGIDDRPVSPEEGYKSIGHETTFERDTADAELVGATLLELVEKVARRLRAHGVACRTVTVKLRDADFSTHTRRTTLDEPADTAERIAPVAARLMRSLTGGRGKLVRLVGVYASNLFAPLAGGQLELFAAPPRKDRELAAAVDSIVHRYGEGAITRARLVAGGKKRSSRGGI
jgi:nucleotidyltransferase/DNA polymerase involved in DNA repair